MLSSPNPTPGQPAGASEEVAQARYAIEPSQVREVYRANRVGEIARVLGDPEKQQQVAAALEQAIGVLGGESRSAASHISEQMKANLTTEMGRFSMAREIVKSELPSKDEIVVNVGNQAYTYDSILDFDQEIGEPFRKAVDRSFSQIRKSPEYLEMLTKAASEEGSISVVFDSEIVSKCLEEVYGTPENYLLSKRIEREAAVDVLSNMAEEMPESEDREMVEEMAHAFKAIFKGLHGMYDVIDGDFLSRYWKEPSEEIS